MRQRPLSFFKKRSYSTQPGSRAFHRSTPLGGGTAEGWNSRRERSAMTDNSDIVFTPAARAAQAERGSAPACDKGIAVGFPDRVTPELASFIGELDTAFLSTVSPPRAPDIQHPRGPTAFILVPHLRPL